MTILSAYDVVVDSDLSINMSVEDATETITFNPLMRDRSVLAPELYDEDQETILDKGNAWELHTITDFCSNKYGRFLDYSSYEMRLMYEGEEVLIGNREIKAMPNNDLSIDRVYASFNSDGSNIIYLPAADLKSAVISNNVDDYAIIDEEYVPSPFSQPSEFGDGITPYDKSRGFSAYFWFPGDANSFGGMGTTVINMDFENRVISVCQPKDAPRQIWPVLRYNEWDIVTTDSWPIDPLSNRVLGINTIFHQAYLGDDAGWYPSEEECVNEHLCFELEKGGKWGDGVPVAQTLTMNQVANKYANSRYSFSLAYSGNMGEERRMDAEIVEAIIKVNDEPATEQQLREISSNQLPENSVISWEYVNNNISPIEGIAPFNRGETRVSTNTSDREAPTVQALRFLDKEGIPEIRFQTPNDGKLMLYCGDFEFHQLDFGYWYGYKETPGVTLEYRPNGTDSFTTLQCEEDEQKFFMPGFGACFEAELSQINSPSANKWYDLRITLVDAAGNSQQQILSPAFRIENVNPSGVEMSSSSNLDKFDVYSAQGVLVAKSADKNILSSLLPGIYIISGKKIVIK